MDNKPSLSQYFGGSEVPPASQFFDEIGTSPSDMIQSIYLGDNEGDQTTASSHFPTNMTASFKQQQVSEEMNFSNVLPTVSGSTPLPATSLPDPSTFFDTIGPEPNIGPIKSGITSPGLITEAMEGLSIKNQPVDKEADRRRDAWIPNDETQKILLKAQSSPRGSFFPDREMLTTPGLILEEELADALQEVAVKYLGVSCAGSRGVVRAEHVSRDEAGLRELLRTGYLRAAVNLTAVLITAAGQGVGRMHRPTKHTPRSLQLWLTRFALMLRIKLHEPLTREAEPFGDCSKPDMFYQFYPEIYENRSGSLVPFSLRLLLAELPGHLGKPDEAVDRLYAMLDVIQKMVENLRNGKTEDGSGSLSSEQDKVESMRLWSGRETRVLHSITNCAIAMKDYRHASKILKRLQQQAPSGVQRRGAHSAMCRVWLLGGHLRAAISAFELAREARHHLCPTPDVREYVDLGLLDIAQGKYQDAYNNFARAADQEPTNIMKKQNSKKRKASLEDNTPNNTVSKKLKLENGFIIESCVNVTPSVTSEHSKENNISLQNINDENKKKNDIKTKKLKKPKLGEDIAQMKSDLTPEDMLTWAEFKLPEPIMKALMELGFKQPTKIQQLTLPAAIHGRRDILGAAETGSGKTLAFGLPILTGILKLKEKAELKNLDVYDIPYKKTSVKKKNNEQTEFKKDDHKKKKNVGNNKLKKDSKIPNKVQAKESSEDGYGSNEDSTDYSEDDEEDKPIKNGKEGSISDEEFLEEIEVPVKKKVVSADEGNDSDDSDNYIHLSDMLDSDDLAESDDASASGDEENLEVLSDNENKNDSEEIDDAESDADGDVEESVVAVKDDGIGLVKVLDDVEIPGHAIVKTGKPLYALIVTPTRELAIQISRHLTAAAKYTGIKIATIVGGMAAVKQERLLRRGPEVVVATPGRLWELINQGQPHLQQLASVKFLAIDETDRMVERGHFEELHPLLERLNIDEERRSTRQNFVFSATLTLVHDLPTHMKGKKVTKHGKIINRKIEKMTPKQKVDRLIKMIGMTDPKVVDITTSLGTAETLTECRITCSLEHKDASLYYILKRHPGRTIVFCNSIGNVKRLAQLLTLLKCNPLPLHANMQQRQRLKNLERFRDDPHGVLISTDVAARGLDIPNVDHVVHYQVPRTAENYVHRSGRTARANKEGLTILMMEPSEAYLYAKLCRTLNKTSELETFPVASQTLSSLIELVQVARDLDALYTKQRRAAQSVGWRDKAAREMDIIVDDDDLPVKQIDPSIEKALRAKKRQLESLLTRPLYPRGFSFKYPTLNDPSAFNIPKEKALEVMKKAIESGELKKQKRKSKNAPLLTLEKVIKAKNKSEYRKKK